MCEVDRHCNFSFVFTYVRPSSLSNIYRDRYRDHWRRTKLRTSQKTCRKRAVPNYILLTWGIFVDQKMTFGLGKISHMTNFWRILVGKQKLNVQKPSAIHSNKVFTNKCDRSACWIFAWNGLRFNFRWHLRAYKLKNLNYVTDTASCSRVKPFFSGTDADQT